MKQAGIKVWVLTGDKVGTAKNIGMSAGLLDPVMETHEVVDDDHCQQHYLHAIHSQIEENNNLEDRSDRRT